MVVLFVVLTFAVAIGISWYLEMRRNQILNASPIVKKQAYQLKIKDLNIPAGVYFSPTHSWAHLESNGKAKIGIDSFIQGLTGILSAIHVPEEGATLKQGDPMFSLIHKGKKLVVTAPVSGQVRSINAEALQNMRMVHRNPYSSGWLVEMEPGNWEQETQQLYLGQRTVAWFKSEVRRIRDFFAYSLSPPDADKGLVLLQEGGDIAESALAFSDNELWAAFQTQILNEANMELTTRS